MGWSYQRLHNGVVGGIHVGIKGEGAFSITVVGCVAVRSNNPVLRETREISWFWDEQKWTVLLLLVQYSFTFHVTHLTAVGKFRVNVLSADKSTALSVKSLRANPSPPSFLPSFHSFCLTVWLWWGVDRLSPHSNLCFDLVHLPVSVNQPSVFTFSLFWQSLSLFPAPFLCLCVCEWLLAVSL